MARLPVFEGMDAASFMTLLSEASRRADELSGEEEALLERIREELLAQA